LSEDYITIGKILKPLGLRGEVKVALLTDFPDRFNSLRDAMVCAEGSDPVRLEISSVRHGPPFIYLTFMGRTNIHAVESLRGALLKIPEEERLTLPEGQYFHDDLIGMDVFVKCGGKLGKITRIFEAGSNDIFVVSNGQREYLIPAIQKVIKTVHLEQGRLLIEPMEGLLDL